MWELLIVMSKINLLDYRSIIDYNNLTVKTVCIAIVLNNTGTT